MLWGEGWRKDGSEIIVVEEGMGIETPQKSLCVPFTARVMWHSCGKQFRYHEFCLNSEILRPGWCGSVD